MSAGVRAGGVDALFAQRGDRGGDGLDLLAAHGAGLARMGIEPREREARPRDAEPSAQIVGDDTGGGEDALGA